MEGAPLQPPSALQPFFWSPGWNSIQSVKNSRARLAARCAGGDPGVRLFEPSQRRRVLHHDSSHLARRQRNGWFVPIEHIFGSEELSLHAPAIAELAFEPYLALNPDDAGSLGLR